jgi:hypothetical protein
MIKHQELHILQYNIWKSKDVVLASLFQDRWIREYDVLAIQEPWRNPFIPTTYHPLKTDFQLAYLEHKATRVCFYINKRIDPSTWNTTHLTKDITMLEISNPTLGNKLRIINVYNEIGTNTLADLRDAVHATNPEDELLVLGDFNLHHPLWSTTRRYAQRGIAAAQPLITMIEEFHLRLLTVPGTTTHRWKDGESTIDLTFGSEGVASRMIYCRVDPSRDCDSDHLPISMAIAWDWHPAAPSRKRQWAKTDISSLQHTVKEKLPRVPGPVELSEKHSIDRYTHSIIDALQAGIDASTPWSNPSSRSLPGLDQECKDICVEVQRLRRRWQRTRDEDDYEAYRVARNSKGRHVQKALHNTHRQRVEEASTSDSGLWRLVKWAKNRHAITPTCTPALQKPGGGFATQAEEKAETLRQSFFPPPLNADLSDIGGYMYPPPIECPEITPTEIKRAVHKAAPNKAPGTDNIPDGILHQTIGILLPHLHRLFNACLQIGYCPAHFRESITVVLRKPGKDDYTQPKSYRPIALLNTLGKR